MGGRSLIWLPPKGTYKTLQAPRLKGGAFLCYAADNSERDLHLPTPHLKSGAFSLQRETENMTKRQDELIAGAQITLRTKPREWIQQLVELGATQSEVEKAIGDATREMRKEMECGFKRRELSKAQKASR